MAPKKTPMMWLVCAALCIGAAQAQQLSEKEELLLRQLLDRKAARANPSRPARAFDRGPRLATEDGDMVVAVEAGKKVGYRVGKETIYFSQLPDSWQGDDDKCFKALDVGYKLGQASPGTNSIMEVIKSTVDGKAGELDKTIKATIAQTNADAKEHVEQCSACAAKGLALVGGKCVPATWVVAADSKAECTAENEGALRYEKSSVLLCGEDKKWRNVSPLNLGAFASAAAKSCGLIKKEGFSQGDKKYWLIGGDGKPTLMFCDMTGSGEVIGDGSSKVLSAKSCIALFQTYPGKLSKKPAQFWINFKQIACGLADDGATVITYGDGSSKEFSGVTCQDILDRYGKGLWGSSKDLKRFIVGKGDVTCSLSADGKKAASTFGGTSESDAAPSCKYIKTNIAGVKSGVFWVMLTPHGGKAAAKKVFCNHEFQGGGWTLMYSSRMQYTQQKKEMWWLDWKQTTQVGVNFQGDYKLGSVSGEKQYLLPLTYWSRFNKGDVHMTSEQSTPGMRLKKWSINPNDRYRWTWASNIGANNEFNAINYHKNMKLSTRDYDGDQTGGHCGNGGHTFGWFKSCCNLCMVTRKDGAWRNKGRSGSQIPSDWYYRGTEWMRWWAREA